jgi:hypothetical protein
MTDRIGYDSLTQDDLPGMNPSKNPVLYKLSDTGSDMLFSFSGDHPTWSTDGAAWHDFYAGSTDRKVYNCNYLDENWSIPGVNGRLQFTNWQLIIEEGSAQLNYALYNGFFTDTNRDDTWNGDDARLILTNVHDPSDTWTLSALIDSVFNGMPRNFEYWGTSAGTAFSGLGFRGESKTMYSNIHSVGQDFFYSGSMNWKMRKS